ncbi:MAG: rod shape-determining protein MreD [Ignavibacteria bacterium]|nr:rod shape-determining protein MreD [Ignavibacteria bacterium]
MKWDFILPLPIFLLVLLIQITIVPLISFAGVVPDLILILLVYYSIIKGQLYGTILGASFGIFVDLITGGLLGSAMLSKTVVGFISGYFSSETKREINITTYYFSLIVFICAIVESVIFSFFSTFDLRSNIFSLFFEQALLPALYTGVVSILFILSPIKRKSF